MSVKLADRYTEYPFTGNAAIDETIVHEGAQEWRLAGFSIHGSANFTSADITFTVDSRRGANYDVEILSETIPADTDHVKMIPSDERVPLKVGDELDIAFANAGGATYGLVVYIEHE